MNDDPLLWIDLETTGLDPYDHNIIEVAAVLTTPDLDELDRYHAVTPMPDEVTWATAAYRMHCESGLVDWWAACTTPPSTWDPVDVDEMSVGLRSMIAHHTDTPPVLAGYSVHFDRKWLAWHMPDVVEALHHRHLDVSSVRRFMRHTGYELDFDDVTHRAMDDVEHAIGVYGAYVDAVTRE